MNDLFNKVGFITLDGSKYSFSITKENILFHRIEGKAVEFLPITGHYEFIIGSTTMGANVYFYHLNVHTYNIIDDFLIGNAYAIFYPRLENEQKTNYQNIKFYGDTINRFYPPINILAEDSSDELLRNPIKMEKYQGDKSIKLASFKDTTKEYRSKIKGKECDLRLSIVSPRKMTADDTSLGNVNSYFEIDFSEEQDFKDLLEYVSITRRFFNFIYNRSQITFQTISIFRKENKSGKNIKMGELYINDKTNASDIPSKSRECVRIGNLGNNLGVLFENLQEKDLNLEHLPHDKNDSMLVDSSKYVAVAASFQCVFDFYNKKYVNEDKNFIIVVDELNAKLDEMDTKYKGKNLKARKWIKKIKKDIEFQGTSLQHKYNSCFKNMESVRELFDTIKERYKIEEDTDLGEYFSSTRNEGAHSLIKGYDNPSILAFVLARAMIHAMIFENAGIDKNNIKLMINLLFAI